MRMSMQSYLLNQNREMLILAISRFAVTGAPPGSRDAPGNLLDGIKLQETFENLDFRLTFDRRGEFTKPEAQAAVWKFVQEMDPRVDMAAVAVLSHGDFDKGGQVIEFSDGFKMYLGFGQKHINYISYII